MPGRKVILTSHILKPFLICLFYFCSLLPPGKHDLELSQTTLDNPTTGTQSFAYDVKYHLIVEGNNSTQNQLGK